MDALHPILAGSPQPAPYVPRFTHHGGLLFLDGVWLDWAYGIETARLKVEKWCTMRGITKYILEFE